MEKNKNGINFNVSLAKERCKNARLRILEISQKVSALHAGAAFSCIDMLDCVYNGFINKNSDLNPIDKFILSKGHGGIAQYVVLEQLGILDSSLVDSYCSSGGKLGCHPDYGLPGIEASTGSLGHGMSLSIGMAHAKANILNESGNIFILLSDGEFQEGSTWEAMMMAANLKLKNLIAVLDHNGFQSFGRTSDYHPAFYPIKEKIESFGWEVDQADGHDNEEVYNKIKNRSGEKPFLLIGNTTKGKGVSFMENVPIWHYRSPSPEEYIQAVSEIKG